MWTILLSASRVKSWEERCCNFFSAQAQTARRKAHPNLLFSCDTVQTLYPASIPGKLTIRKQYPGRWLHLIWHGDWVVLCSELRGGVFLGRLVLECSPCRWPGLCARHSKAFPAALRVRNEQIQWTQFFKSRITRPSCKLIRICYNTRENAFWLTLSAWSVVLMFSQAVWSRLRLQTTSSGVLIIRKGRSSLAL